MTAANNYDFKAKESTANRQKLKTLKEGLELELRSRDIAQSGIVESKELLKRITEYLNEKKSKGLQAVYSAIYSARNIIPNTSDIELVIDKETAYFANIKGFNVDSVEGSAFRAIISLFTRDRFLKAMPQRIQTVLLDEALATLDQENSAKVSKYVELIAEKSPIIMIEQKDAVFETVKHTCYSFRNTEGVTTVRKEIVGEEGGE